MASKLHPPGHFLLLLLLLSVLSAVAAHNITTILSEAPNFGTFNSLLSRTSLAHEINNRQTITVLALDEGAAASLNGLPDKALTEVLSIHVVLDYYDTAKLKGLKPRSTLMTTLLQTTGNAKNNMGFINFTRFSDTQFEFGSGVPGAPLVANYVKTVSAKPYNISVLQISSAIVPPGMNMTDTDKPTAKATPPAAAAPAAPKKKEHRAPAPSSADVPSADSPADAPKAEAPAKKKKKRSRAEAPEDEVSSDEVAAPTEDEAEDESESSSAGKLAGAGLLAAAGNALFAIL